LPFSVREETDSLEVTIRPRRWQQAIDGLTTLFYALVGLAVTWFAVGAGRIGQTGVLILVVSAACAIISVASLTQRERVSLSQGQLRHWFETLGRRWRSRSQVITADSFYSPEKPHFFSWQSNVPVVRLSSSKLKMGYAHLTYAEANDLARRLNEYASASLTSASS